MTTGTDFLICLTVWCVGIAFFAGPAVGYARKHPLGDTSDQREFARIALFFGVLLWPVAIPGLLMYILGMACFNVATGLWEYLFPDSADDSVPPHGKGDEDDEDSEEDDYEDDDNGLDDYEAA